MVVGIGLNVAWPGPEGAGGTCLDDLRGVAPRVDRHVLLDQPPAASSSVAPPAARRGAAGGGRWPASSGVAAPRWGKRCGSCLAEEALDGVATALDDAGRLVVETASGPRHLAAGDVVHLRRWTPGADGGVG